MNNVQIINRIFSQTAFDNVLQKGSFRDYASGFEEVTWKSSNREIFKELYNILRESYRNEYYYKNTLFNRHIIGRHSLNTTSAINELPINNSKADFIKLNGEAVVYEVKTELDSFSRLEGQINDYYKAFTKIYVVTSESQHLRAIELLQGTNVGVLVLTEREYFSERKKAYEDIRFLEHESIFKILRKYEYESIIRKHIGHLPKVAPAFYYKTCFKYFNSIPLMELYPTFIQLLKQRNNIISPDIIIKAPYEVRLLSYLSAFVLKNSDKMNEFFQN